MKMIKCGLFLLALLPVAINCKMQAPAVGCEEHYFDKKESLIAYLNDKGISENDNAMCQDFFSFRNWLTIPFAYSEKKDKFHRVAKEILEGHLQDLQDGEQYHLAVCGPIEQGCISKIFSLVGIKIFEHIDYKKPDYIDIKLGKPDELKNLTSWRNMPLYTGPLP